MVSRGDEGPRSSIDRARCARAKCQFGDRRLWWVACSCVPRPVQFPIKSQTSTVLQRAIAAVEHTECGGSPFCWKFYDVGVRQATTIKEERMWRVAERQTRCRENTASRNAHADTPHATITPLEPLAAPHVRPDVVMFGRNGK